MGEVIRSWNRDGICNNMMTMGFWYGIEYHRDSPKYVKITEEEYIYLVKSAAVLRRITSSGCSVKEAWSQFAEWMNDSEHSETIWDFN